MVALAFVVRATIITGDTEEFFISNEQISAHPFAQHSIPPLLRSASSIIIEIGTGYLCIDLNSMRKSQRTSLKSSQGFHVR